MGSGLGDLRDYHDIVALTHDYCWALDTGDWASLRDIFVPDASADLGAGGQKGIDEIIDRVASALAGYELTQHLVGSHQVSLEDDRADGRCYLQAQHVRPSGEMYMVGARYEDRYIRTPQGWRIGHRTIVPMWTQAS